ncbi:MAG TPA: hypothetical protein VJB70_00325 [Candidatus Paceibacterota bacterium]
MRYLNKAPSGALSLANFPTYKTPKKLWVITTYYNPCRYATRRKNYDVFIASMRRSGISVLTVECAFGDAPFELPDSLDTIQIRSSSLLWQKERLLNLATSWLPPECNSVAWIDCDILFQNPRWAIDTERLLETHAVVQLFESCLRLEKGNVTRAQTPDRSFSFGTIAPKNPGLLSCGRYDLHGHTGYGWAMQRVIFDAIGLYEYAVGGSADHFIAHSIYNEYGFCIQHTLGTNQRATDHLIDWGRRFNQLVSGGFTAVPGEILHLWHGELVNRRYHQRLLEINALKFDPYQDVVATPGKPLEWHPNTRKTKPKLIEYFASYFENRCEDG